jgi:N-acetylglucosaminyldiphosphoundecaprenol N-acetyl-beta-D-mannosaminyltransferase
VERRVLVRRSAPGSSKSEKAGRSRHRRRSEARTATVARREKRVGVTSVYVAGLRVTPADLNRALSFVWEDASTGHAHVYAFVNAYSASLRRSSPEYADVLAADTTTGLPDGVAVSVGARMLGLGAIGRCPGPDLLDRAAEIASRDGTSFALVGGDSGVAQRLGSRLAERHPALRIVLAETPPHGEWPVEWSREVCARAKESGAAILWMGVSAPKQEVWAHRFCAELGMPVVCVGAAFDFLSDSVTRAPRWVRAIGLEWLFRLLCDPRRLWRRYVIGNAVFLFDLFRWGRSPARG